MTPQPVSAGQQGWKKSSFSEGGDTDGQCVDVNLGDMVGVRRTQDPDGPQVWFTREEWRAFVLGVKNDEFDV